MEGNSSISLTKGKYLISLLGKLRESGVSQASEQGFRRETHAACSDFAREIGDAVLEPLESRREQGSSAEDVG